MVAFGCGVSSRPLARHAPLWMRNAIAALSRRMVAYSSLLVHNIIPAAGGKIPAYRLGSP